MISLPQTKVEGLENTVKPAPKKQRNGRWTTPEIYLFESLLERYGKNWKKIHQYMKGRSLSQIRSHAQKYFSKLGSKKVEEYERRAKLIEAYEIIEKEKRLRDEKDNENIASNSAEQVLVKHQEEILETIEQESKESTKMNEILANDKSSEIIKEQVKQSQQIQKQKVLIEDQNQPFMTYFPTNQGFLISLIQLYPQNFKNYGIGGFIDNGAFNQVDYHQ